MVAPGIHYGATLQLINPKAFAVDTFLFGTFVLYPENFARSYL